MAWDTNGSEVGNEIGVGSRLVWVPCLGRRALEEVMSVPWVIQSPKGEKKNADSESIGQTDTSAGGK